jgi:formylglycine-generating enzyme required for sulfatase activity
MEITAKEKWKKIKSGDEDYRFYEEIAGEKIRWARKALNKSRSDFHDDNLFKTAAKKVTGKEISWKEYKFKTVETDYYFGKRSKTFIRFIEVMAAYCNVHASIFIDESLNEKRFRSIINKGWGNHIQLDDNRISRVASDERFNDGVARELMVEYCKAATKYYEHKILNQFWPEGLPSSISDDDIIEEFFKYKPTQLIDSYGQKINYTQNSKKINVTSLLNDENTMIFGNGGVGKTRFMLELAKSLTRDCAEGNCEPCVPIYFEAKFLLDNKISEFEQYVHKYLIHIFLSKYPKKKISAFADYLFQNNKIIALIDAFDQVMNRSKEERIVFLLESKLFFGNCLWVISSRPTKQNDLIVFLKRAGYKEDQVVYLRLLPFDDSEFEAFIGPKYFPKIKPILKYLNNASLQSYFSKEEFPFFMVHRGEIRSFPINDDYKASNFIQIPVLARMLKLLAIRNQLPVLDNQKILNSAWLMEEFAESIKKRQIEIEGSENEDLYDRMYWNLHELSLKTLQDKNILNFKGKYVFNKYTIYTHMKEERYKEYWQPMLRSGLIKLFVDIEDEIFYEDKVYRFHHQMFQDFFAAKAIRMLFRNYKNGYSSLEKLNENLEKLEYIQSVGEFLAELMELEFAIEIPDEEFKFWHLILMDERINNCVRTYALQVRDVLGAGKAKDMLIKCFEEEDRQLNNSKVKNDWILIPSGPFLRGSYTRGYVFLEILDDFEISRNPITNIDFCRFLNATYDACDDPLNRDDLPIFSFEQKQIIIKNSKFMLSKPEYSLHPVTSASQWGANAYCEWMTRRQDGYEYRLPTSKEWEKAARGCQGRIWPWGNIYDVERANTLESKINDTLPVGSFPNGKSPYGCYDMTGNMFEYTKKEGGSTVIPIHSGSYQNPLNRTKCSSLIEFDEFGVVSVCGFRCVRNRIK